MGMFLKALYLATNSRHLRPVRLAVLFLRRTCTFTCLSVCLSVCRSISLLPVYNELACNEFRLTGKTNKTNGCNIFGLYNETIPCHRIKICNQEGIVGYKVLVLLTPESNLQRTQGRTACAVCILTMSHSRLINEFTSAEL